MSDMLAASSPRLRNGDVLAGIVVNKADFGLFIDVGGVVGLCHSSKSRRAWQTHAIGDRVTVAVIGVDKRMVWLRLVASLASANRAAAQIEARLAFPSWLSTIGVAKAFGVIGVAKTSEAEFRVEIGVSKFSEAILDAIPVSVDGVDVEVHHTGPIHFARE